MSGALGNTNLDSEGGPCGNDERSGDSKGCSGLPGRRPREPQPVERVPSTCFPCIAALLRSGYEGEVQSLLLGRAVSDGGWTDGFGKLCSIWKRHGDGGRVISRRTTPRGSRRSTRSPSPTTPTGRCQQPSRCSSRSSPSRLMIEFRNNDVGEV
ncbi:hypothetical protein FJTKL_06978 [Diaporthe vaccinii]|uniref:Uncharacterized protein n=1 Tax=Diaporthe vaccinii TaxID=105482 RepID=A0ABR4DPJ6_9PEZI